MRKILASALVSFLFAAVVLEAIPFAQNVGVRFRRQPWSSFCYALLPCRDTPPLLPRN
jgi:hypothetical protein